ncbi:hypothetical protein F1728_15350 [Gimesia benthica]|uniref:Uncharacterized protein n=1 Tax=Gimesia benthica TaxID=2608982 RepID=A0A6I6AC71_9PLAN|nr:hypothetical protein [Gimesia benthica]QGQ23973.1 hypothetical protein F1728_15350 [Gimesia benthica]
MTVEKQTKEKKKTKEQEDDSPSPYWLLLAAILVIAVLIIFWYSVTKLICKPEQQGQFGDMFGAANTLFSGLAFAGIIYTIWLQRTELKLQRHELQETKEELKLSRMAHVKTSEIMDAQLDILKNTSKLENARYRKEVLPFFVLRYSDNNNRKEQEGYLKLRIELKNVGQKINEIFLVQLRDDLPPGNPDQELKHIGEQTDFTMTALCPANEEDSVEYFDMSFSTMDGILWKTKLTFFVVNHEVRSFIFGNPTEVAERKKIPKKTAE